MLSIPWFAWFVFRLFEELTRWPRPRQAIVVDLTLLLMAVPIGLPVLLVVVGWVSTGFFRPSVHAERGPLPDYEDLVRRAVNGEPLANRKERKAIYLRARSALEDSNRHLTLEEREAHRKKLDRAVRSAERDFAAQERTRAKAEKASTALLVFTVFIIPEIWLLDVSSLAPYWIARLPKLKSR